ncbi:Conserved_hypothetical protein [Hexamita inflata]|uniref:Uncharacterized protein n=1 Tax=Hexamita inflata TaxID=28002 RepID=A0AA86UT31_9EUKA|nr:Conserved hypothetical protein [Hexamita inflata]
MTHISPFELRNKPQLVSRSHPLFLISNNPDLYQQFDLTTPPSDIFVLNRLSFNKENSPIQTKLFLKENKNVFVQGVFTNNGTRADYSDLYNLLQDGAAGFILETDEGKIVQGAMETIHVFENEQL